MSFRPDVDENNRTKIDREGLPILHRFEDDRFGFAEGEIFQAFELSALNKVIFVTTGKGSPITLLP